MSDVVRALGRLPKIVRSTRQNVTSQGEYLVCCTRQTSLFVEHSAPSSKNTCICTFQIVHLISKYCIYLLFILFECTEVCRHGVPLKAVNIIKSGERYGLAHLIYWTDAVLKNTQIQYYDVACKVKYSFPSFASV